MNNNINLDKKKTFIASNIKKIFKIILERLEDKEYLKKYVTNKNCLIRDRKLNIVILSKLLFTKTFLSLTAFLSIHSKNNKKALVTKQAYSKARKNISYTLFQDLNTELIDNIYQEYSLKLFEDKYLLFSIDGTTLELPNTKKLREEFGHTKSQMGARENARASATCIYDSMNELILTSVIDNYNTSERKMAMELIEQLKSKESIKKDILYLMDRGYYSKEMLIYFCLNNQNFLFRLTGNTLSKYFEEIEKDGYITISLNEFSKGIKNKEFKEKLKEKEMLIKLRFTKIVLESGEEEHLLSNIDNIPYKKMKELYFKRWRIEENYKFLKTKMQIENFSGKTRITILQDFYASIINANIQYLINQSSRKKQSKRKREYQTNKNFLASLYKNNILLNILMKVNKLCSYIDRIIELISNYQILKPLDNRSFVRNKDERVKANKFCVNIRPI